MFRILVADDESVIRKGIIAILKRALDANIEFLEASDGIEALELCNEQRPQIVITDIRMPRLNGLEFIQSVAGTRYMPDFIILSGYADFEYAKSAISLGVKEYILKPINKQELITITDRYVKKITGEKQRIQLESERDDANERVAKALRQELAVSLLNCSSANEARGILEKLAELNVNFHKQLSACVMVQYRVDDKNKEYIDFAVKNILDELVGQETRFDYVFTLQYDSGRLVVIFEGREHESMLTAAKQVLGKACSLIYRHLDTEVFAGIGEVVYGSAFIFKSFESACKTANFKLYGLGRNVLAYSEIALGEVSPPTRFDDLTRSLENMNSAEIAARFESLIQLTPSLNALSAVEQSYARLAETIGSQMAKYNFARTDSSLAPIPFFRLWSFTQLKQKVMQYAEHVQECACEASIDVSNKKLIVEVLRYVKENAAKDINLNIVAEHFSRTPAYMSALFKKGAGEGFNIYLTNIRMDMAKEMLADSSIPIGEVSSLCGYLNPKYFSVVFKKTVGVGPGAYRQNCLK